MVIQLWNDWLARRVLSRRTMSLVSTLRTVNIGHVQNWHRWKLEGTVVWASRSSKAIGQISAPCTYGYSYSVNQRMWGGAGQAPWTFLEQRYSHIYRCTSFGSFWAYSEITVVQRGIVGPGGEQHRKKLPFHQERTTREMRPSLWKFPIPWNFKMSIVFFILKKKNEWIIKIWTVPTIILILAGSRQSNLDGNHYHKTMSDFKRKFICTWSSLWYFGKGLN